MKNNEFAQREAKLFKSLTKSLKPKFNWDNVLMLIAWIFQPTNVLLICATIITITIIK